MAIVGVLSALWSASGYVGAFTEASNSIYEVEEGRPVWKKKPLQILITFVCIMLVAITALALVLTGPLAKAVGGAIGLGDTAITVWQIAKWPVLLGLVLVILHVLYFASPNAKVGVEVDLGRHRSSRSSCGSSPRRCSRSTSRSSAPTTRPTARWPASSSSSSGSGSRTWRCCSASSSTRRRSARASCARGRPEAEQELKVPERDRPVAEAATVHRLSTLGRRWRRPSPSSPRCASAARRAASSRRATRRRSSPPCRRPTTAGEPLLIVAGGSNLVVADAGFPGTVLRIASRGIDGGTVAAGEEWDPFVARCVAAGLAGVECLSGIPGSVGATPIQNVGAYGQEVADVIVSVRAYDRRAREVLEIPAADCGFAYRSSAFKRDPGHWVVLSVTFDLPRQDRSMPIRYAELARALGVEQGGDGAARRRARGRARAAPPQGHGRRPGRPGLRLRRLVLHQPRPERGRLRRARGAAWPTAPARPASRSPTARVKTSAAWLIEHAGFARGHGDPATIAISSKHTLALTNRGAGTTEQLVALAREIADGVHERFGVELEPEPVFAGHAWRS